MSIDWEILGSEGIRFFGRLGTTASREMTRLLGELGQQAELLDDLAAQAERGMPPDARTLERVSFRLKTGMERGRALLDRVRRVSSSVNHPVGLVNVSEIAERMVDLFRGRAEQRQVGLAIKGANSPAFAASNVFFLQNLLYLGLEHALERAGTGPVEVIVRSQEDGASVEITSPGPAEMDPVLRGKVATLVQSLQAQFETREHSLHIRLPNRGRLIQALRGPGPDSGPDQESDQGAGTTGPAG